MLRLWLIRAASSVRTVILMRGPWADARIVVLRGLRARRTHA
jgi:hypothetical protein